MYLLFARNGESGNSKERVAGKIMKAEGSVKEFIILPNTVQKMDFQYGDKVVCVSGSFMMLVHPNDKQVVAVDMHDRYWLPFHEVIVTEEFIERQKTEQVVLPLTGVNHRVMTGMVLR